MEKNPKSAGSQAKRQAKTQVQAKKPKKPRAKRNEITREKIIDCAFCELKENGWQQWNARKIAARAGCSTMPIFRLFENMDEVKQAVISRALKVYEEYIYGGMREEKPYKGTGRAFIRFAKEQPWLFKALCVSEEFTGRSFAAIDPTIGSVMREAQKAGDLQGERLKRLHACMTIFVYGAGAMAASGSHLVPSDEMCDTLMSDVFLALKEYYRIPPAPTEPPSEPPTEPPTEPPSETKTNQPQEQNEEGERRK